MKFTRPSRKYWNYEVVCVDHLRRLINNLLIDNPNYNNRYFLDNDKFTLMADTIGRAQYILDEIARMFEDEVAIIDEFYNPRDK